MKERPILMSAPMVRALLARTKTQTRRAFKLPKGHRWDELQGGMASGNIECDRWPGTWHVSEFVCPYGQPGDQLWVRETWAYGIHALSAENAEENGPWVYAADGTTQGRLCDRWHPSIHMRRAASRINLEVTGVRLERLQDISVADSLAEGVEWQPIPAGRLFLDTSTKRRVPQLTNARESYRTLWEQINGPGSWNLNPWVWVVEFA